MNFLRLNGKNLDLKLDKYDLPDGTSSLELQPIVKKGTYSVLLKVGTKTKYEVCEGNSRNQVSISKDQAKVYLTSGANVLFTPSDTENSITMEIKGLKSPLQVSVDKQNLIFKVVLDR
jgi:hypothetical protein